MAHDFPGVELARFAATLRYDASKGLDAPAGLKMTTRWKGDAANALRQLVAARFMLAQGPGDGPSEV